MHRRIVVGSKEDVNNEIIVLDEEGKEYSIKGNKIQMYEYIDRMIDTSEILSRAYSSASRNFDANSNVLSSIRYLMDECERIIINRAKFEERLSQKFYGYHQDYLSEQERNYFNEFENVDTDFQNLISELNSLVARKNEFPRNTFESMINNILYRLNNAKERVIHTDKELSPALSRAMESNHTIARGESQYGYLERQSQGAIGNRINETPAELTNKISENEVGNGNGEIANYEDKGATSTNEVPSQENNKTQENSSATYQRSPRRRRTRNRRADRYKTDQMITEIQDYEFSRSSTEDDIASLMAAFGIAEDSDFYKYIKARIDFASRIDLDYIEDRMKNDPHFISANIYNYIKQIKEQNKELIERRYRHYELYRGLDAGAPSITDYKYKGRTYFSMVAGLDISSAVKIGNLLRGIYHKSMSEEQLEKLAIDIEDELLRIKKFDESLEDVSRYIIATGDINPRLRLFDEKEAGTPKKAKAREFKGNEKFEKLIKFARENPGKIAAVVGASILLGVSIAGISSISWDDISSATDGIVAPISVDYENQQDNPTEIPVISSDGSKLEQEGEKKDNVEDNDAVGNQAWNISEGQTIPLDIDLDIKSTNDEREAYSFADVVGNMSQEEIELYGAAIKEGDGTVPSNVYGLYGVSYGIGNIDNAESLELAFKRIDSLFACSNSYTNSHALSYQSVEFGEAVIKQHISEAYGVPVDKIGFYYNMPDDNTDMVNRVDVLLLDDNGEREGTLVKSYHMDTRLQEALKMIGGLRKVRCIVSPFEESQIIHKDTRILYDFLRRVLNDEFEFQKNGKDLKIVEPGSQKEVYKSDEGMDI